MAPRASPLTRGSSGAAPLIARRLSSYEKRKTETGRYLEVETSTFAARNVVELCANRSYAVHLVADEGTPHVSS